jgi:hypothetical protein
MEIGSIWRKKGKQSAESRRNKMLKVEKAKCSRT